jgi:hypothetical protein
MGQFLKIWPQRFSKFYFKTLGMDKIYPEILVFSTEIIILRLILKLKSWHHPLFPFFLIDNASKSSSILATKSFFSVERMIEFLYCVLSQGTGNSNKLIAEIVLLISSTWP